MVRRPLLGVAGPVAGLVLAGPVVAGCGGSPVSAPEPTGAPRTVVVSSPRFEEGGAVPAAYTCRGAGTSPELHWAHLPAGTGALALVVDDPDAPGGTYTHWVVVDIAASTSQADDGRPPEGGTELRGSGGRGWKPPCPPNGTHHYRFTVYALRAPLRLPADASPAEAMTAIAGASLAWGRLTGTVSAATTGSGGY